MEKFTFEKHSVDYEANSKEHPTLLLFSRLENPVIKKQILDLWFKYETDRAGKPYQNVYFEDDKVVFVDRVYEEPDYAQLGVRYEEALEIIKNQTSIDEKKSNARGMSLEQIKEQEWTPHQAAIVEAHEKGHAIRFFYNEAPIQSLFDEVIDKDLLILHSLKEKEGLLKTEEEKIESKNNSIGYITSGVEIAERMNQLKNYFGFKADELFTVDHLQYAKKHYVADTGFDNNMRDLFSMIPQEKEQAFVALMNSAGI